jgi:hypothetical protein
MTASVLILTVYARRGLPDDQFAAQISAIKGVAEFDGSTRSWQVRLPFDRPDHLAEVVTSLFETVATYGATVRASVPPA